MKFLAQETIRRKRAGETLSEPELRDFFQAFLSGEVADYQVSAMLMAIYFKGMSPTEGSALTKLMRDSGKVMSWPKKPAPLLDLVDKHSTGGIGDKTSLLLLPLVIPEGIRVPMIAGRGLGHTGGTLDKLESIGWNVHLTESKAAAQLEQWGGFIMGQTEEIAPLDKRLYAMRDVTATVESIPLITASILSKKLAAGIQGLVMDIKTGSGAFMAKLEDAQALADQLRRVGEECGLRMRCLITDMDSPLGNHAGNALEVYECLEILNGRGPEDTVALTMALATEMVRVAYPERPAEELQQRLRQRLKDGSALRLFRDLASAQGADLRYLDHPETLLKATKRTSVLKAADSKKALSRGFVTKVDSRKLGLAILALGGGRRLVTDKIDPWVGLSGLKRVGDSVAEGEPVAVVHARDSATADEARALVEAAYSIGEVMEKAPLILELR